MDRVDDIKVSVKITVTKEEIANSILNMVYGKYPDLRGYAHDVEAYDYNDVIVRLDGVKLSDSIEGKHD